MRPLVLTVMALVVPSRESPGQDTSGQQRDQSDGSYHRHRGYKAIQQQMQTKSHAPTFLFGSLRICPKASLPFERSPSAGSIWSVVASSATHYTALAIERIRH
jgi:hypothetical protein